MAMEPVPKSVNSGTRDNVKNALKSTINDKSIHRRKRAKRYVELPDDSQIFKSKSLNDVRPYYAGDFMDARMASIRESIVYIRQNWDNYDTFLNQLLSILNSKDTETVSVVSMRRDWTTPSIVTGKGDNKSGLVRLYTSADGYEQIFSVLNKILRKEDSIESEEIIRSAVFLIELFNIELFHYCICEPDNNNFQGVVYRGIVLTKDDLDTFLHLQTMDFNKRIIAVPLSLMSTSFDLDSVKDYLLSEMEDNPELCPLMMKIHVIELKPEYLQYYKDKYPSSVVSTICAVDIHELSHFPDECEVILRGAFLQVLSTAYDVELCEGHTCNMIEMVMLNTNRDHISSAFLGEKDTPSRELFRYMNVVTRLEFCVDFYAARKMEKEEAEVKISLLEAREKLSTLMT